MPYVYNPRTLSFELVPDSRRRRRPRTSRPGIPPLKPPPQPKTRPPRNPPPPPADEGFSFSGNFGDDVQFDVLDRIWAASPAGGATDSFASSFGDSDPQSFSSSQSSEGVAQTFRSAPSSNTLPSPPGFDLGPSAFNPGPDSFGRPFTPSGPPPQSTEQREIASLLQQALARGMGATEIMRILEEYVRGAQFEAAQRRTRPPAPPPEVFENMAGAARGKSKALAGEDIDGSFPEPEDFISDETPEVQPVSRPRRGPGVPTVDDLAEVVPSRAGRGRGRGGADFSGTSKGRGKPVIPGLDTVAGIPAPPGYAYAIDPLTQKIELVDTSPLDPTKPLAGWKWISDNPDDPKVGHWLFVPTPDVLDKPWEGVPTPVIGWLTAALNAGGDLNVVPEGPAREWVRWFLTRATEPGRRPEDVPFGLGVPNFPTPQFPEPPAA